MMIADNPVEKEFLDQLVQAGLLIPTGVAGLFGRGQVFEDVLERFDQYITRSAKGDQAESIRFPPVINRKDFECSEFLDSFPQLAGTVFSFGGTEAEHMKLLDLIHEGKDWSEFQKMTDVVLTPAACYPLYPMVARRGPIPGDGHLFDVFSYCFRHEPSGDPARMQMFRMREFVRVGAPEAVVPWRDEWRERGTRLLQSVGLPVATDLANDPFFGRGGRMLAVNQRDQQLKFELLIPICSEEKPTAVMSFNYHQDHFGTLFGLQQKSGETAHTACVGFGMERIVLALFKTHGLDPKNWPTTARETLWT
jgi:seryl-tRNA synthetase